MKSVAKQVNHILIQSKYFKEIFMLLSDTLDLSVVWPIKSYMGIF